VKKWWLLPAALWLAGCGGFGKSGGDDPGAQPAPLPETRRALDIDRRWSFDAGGGIGERFLQLTPARVADALVIADPDGKVAALDIATGKARWRTEVDAEITGGVGGGEGLVLLGTLDAEVIALDARNGDEVWRQQVSSEVLSAPAVSAGVVVVRAIDGRVTGLASSNGDRKWSFRRDVPSLSLRGSSSPLVRQGVVLAGFADGRLVAAELASGKVLWDYRIAEPRGRNEVDRMVDVDAQPLLVGSVLYAASFQGRVMALALGSRKILWVSEVSSHAGMSADEENLYVTDETGVVVALDRLTGNVTWRQEGLRQRAVTGSARLGNWVVVGDFEGYLHFINRRDGEIDGQIKLAGGAVVGSPLVVEELLYALTRGGDLSAVAVAAGKEG
jgi:outer membrane protein assembly factor BamB